MAYNYAFQEGEMGDITRAEKVGIIIAKIILIVAAWVIMWLAMVAIVGG